MISAPLLIIDSDDYAAAGVETMFFSGGEPHVKIPKFSGRVLPYLKLRTWQDVGFGALLVDALHRQFDEVIPAFIPYFPAARQDRSDGLAPFSLAVTGRMFDDADVSVFDVHSPAARYAIKRTRNLMPNMLKSWQRKWDCVIAPDTGAASRCLQFRDAFCDNTSPVLYCWKRRDSQTGRITHYDMPQLPAAGHYVVVDDICDGGMTFNLLAQAFKADPYAKDSTLDLFVSHGIFSKGLEALDPVYRFIYTTDSWCRLPSGGRLSVIPLLPQLLRYWP